jgi:L-alanine-DL-glutamate epimerase-like enolase superfamily enzyme
LIITDVDTFYLAMPDIAPIADGTQDTFLVRLRTDEGLEGWGESDASPLVCMAAYCCPPSHSNIVNLRDSLVGAKLETPADLRRIRGAALRSALDIQQVDHAFAAADIALWDLLGQRLGAPVWALLDGEGATVKPKRPYASSLFAETPELTRALAEERRGLGFEAAKFGWGPMGRDGREADIALVRAAREGLGEGTQLFVDAGWAWGEDAETAGERAKDFAAFDVGWLEEPLLPHAIGAYHALAAGGPAVPIAAAESSGTVREAEDFIDNGRIDVVQIDAGRIGGITSAHEVRRLCEDRGVRYVNHTFKSHLSLAASLHVFATVDAFDLLEYTVGGSPLAVGLATAGLGRADDGSVRLGDAPGLGVTIDLDVVREFLRPVQITIDGRVLELGPQEI